MRKVPKILIIPFLIPGAVFIYLGSVPHPGFYVHQSYMNQMSMTFYPVDRSFFYLIAVLFIVIPPLIILACYKVVNDREMYLIQNGIKSEAKILDMQQTRVYINHNPRIKFLLQITTPYGESYQIEHKQAVNIMDLSYIRVGAVLPVLVDPKNPKKILFNYKPYKII